MTTPSPAGNRFGLIRHATTVWNEQQRIQGQLDSPLTAGGIAAAIRWGGVLAGHRWDRLLCSDSGRAWETARLVNRTLGLPMTADARLREQDWGQWTGMTIAEVTELFARMPPEQAGVGWCFRPPGGESRQGMRERGGRALAAAAERWPGQTVLVVTHNGIIRCLLNHCLGREFSAAEPRFMRPDHLHRLSCRNGLLAVEAVNALDLNGGNG